MTPRAFKRLRDGDERLEVDAGLARARAAQRSRTISSGANSRLSAVSTRHSSSESSTISVSAGSAGASARAPGSSPRRRT